jgi:putative ABC transport system permease protein
MGILFQDIRYGFRSLRKAPAFTAIAVLALGLGIGANTAIFSVADALLLKPLPIPESERLIVLGEQAPGQSGDDYIGVAPANFLDWQQQSKSMQAMTIWMWDSVSLTGEGTPDKAQGYLVMSNFFSLCGVQPLLGRTFLPDENKPGNEKVIILSHALWAARFGSDPQIIGRAIHVDGAPVTVVGVMPASFRFPITADLWMPLALEPALWARRDWRAFMAMGKLNSGVPVGNANAEINGIEARLGQTYPSTLLGWHVLVTPLRLFSIGTDAHNYTLILLLAVGFVLLLICANIANLQFVRGAGRVKEIAIRSALGASRWRVIRQLLTESALIALAGAVFGLLFAQWTIRLVFLNMPSDVAKAIAGWDNIHVDFRALAFTMGAAAVAGLLAGLLPAIVTSRIGLNDTLKEGGRSSSAGRVRQRLRSLLVILQVALAVILLGGGVLLVRAFDHLKNVHRNLRPESLLTMLINLPAERYNKPDKIYGFFDQVMARMSALPGVQGAAATTSLPYGAAHSSHVFSIEGRPWSNPAEAQNAMSESISPNYFQLLGIPLIRGREFTDQDTPAAPRVALISASLARAYWPNENPIGHRVKFGAADDARPPWLSIVGVVSDVSMNWQNPENGFMIYSPHRQFARTYSSLILRTSGRPESFVSAARSVVFSVDPEQPLMDIKPMEQIIRESTINIAYVAVMLAALGVLALALSALGVYGVMSYSVAESTHEIGIRMALGALPGNVLRLTVGRGMILAAAGIAIGIPSSFWLAPLLGSYLSGIGPLDPVTLAEASLVLACVAFIACWIPARRAMRVDPLIALRHE